MKKRDIQVKTAEERLEKTLRQKFVLISFSVVFVVLFLISVVVNSFNYYQVSWKAENLIQIIANNNGTFPTTIPQPNMQPPEQTMSPRWEEMLPKDSHFWDISPRVYEESSYTTRYFTVKLNNEQEIIGLDTSKIQRLSPLAAEDLCMTILAEERDNNIENSFYFQVLEDQDQGSLVIFLDIGEDLYYFRSFLVISVLICFVALAFVLILLICLSKRAVSPIVNAYAKQKKFITDMSHELKTPLSIVKANTEVLELEHGESNWTKSNHKQVEKLNHLVITLLSLAKLEEDVLKGEPEEFSLSHLVLEAGENVHVLVEQQGKSLSMEIEPQLSFLGDPLSIRHILDILLENAVKYSSDGCAISLALKEEKHGVQILVENTCLGLKKGSYNHWFQRFYREEGSRNSETGGFGLGLSMAKTLVRNQDGKITATAPQEDHLVIKVDFKRHSIHKKET